MNSQMIAKDYANDLIFELEKAMWDERGKGGRFRLTILGREFFKSKCLPRLQSNEIDEMIKTIGAVLKENGIVNGLTAEADGRLLRIRIEGCTHRSIEDRMMAHETKPVACIPANLIALAIEEKLNRPVELAEIKLEEGACQTLLVLFDERPVLV